MAAEDNSPEVVRINEVKRLDPSLTLKRNRSQLEALLAQLQAVVRKEELQTNLKVTIPLRGRGLQELTVSHSTRANVPQNVQDNRLYWSDYAAILLDLAAKFKKTSLKDEFAQYAPTDVQLEEWSHAPNTDSTVVSELATWEHRYDIAELAAKLAGAFMTGVEEVAEEATDEPEKPADEDSVTEDDKAKLLQAALAAQQQNRENATAAVPEAAGSDDAPQGQLDLTELPANITPEQAQQLSAAGITLQDLQRRYKNQQQLLIQFSIGQAARDRDIPISQLDPDLIRQITDLANEFIENGDDFSFLFRTDTDRATTLKKFQNFLERAGIPMGTFYTPVQALEQEIKDITKDGNPIVNKNVETTIDAIVISHGEKAVEIIDSFDKQKVELIFGFEGYNLSPTQLAELKAVLKNYATYRLYELTVYTDSDDTKKGLVGNDDIQPEESLVLINNVRDSIATHSKDDDGKGELVADAITTNSNRTSKKIKFALEQNSKIFGAYWQSLTPEEQKIAMAALGTPIPAGDFPTGYELPINIAELNPAIFREYHKAIAEREQLAAELLEQLAYAEEVNAYVHAAQRAEALSLHMRNEYIVQTSAAMTAAMHAQQALDQMSMYEMMASEQALMSEAQGGGEFEASAGGSLLSKFNTTKKLNYGLGHIAKDKSASVAKSKAAEKIAGALAKGSGVLTAAYYGKKALDGLIGKENSNKLLLMLGGLTAGALGAAIYRTIQLMQTIGGAIGGTIGGAVGFLYGGPLGAIAGGLGGATAGANVQNWLMNLFGKGTPTSTAMSSSTFSMSSFGGGSAASTASNAGTVAARPLPTISQAPTAIPPSATTPLSAASNAVSRFTEAVTNAPQTAATGASAAVQTATAAATNIFTSLPAIVVGGSTLVPGLATIIVFLVIMGAFLVPMPFTISKQERTVSKYAIVNKTATPDEIENNTEEDITYEIEIAARTGYSLELKRVSDEFLILGGDATVNGTSPVTLDSFEDTKITLPQSVNYTVSMSGEDALVINTVTFVVDVYDSSGKVLVQGESISTVGLVFIGDPPIGCFKFAPEGTNFTYEEYDVRSAEWTQTEINQVLSAFVRRAGRNPSLTELLCADGDITLVRLHENRTNYVGYVNEGKMALWDTAFNSLDLLEYVFIHELGHILDYRNPGLRNSFLQAKKEPGCFSYPFNCRDAEAFAEGNALYVIYQTYVFSSKWVGLYPFSTENPDSYLWFKTNVFGNIEY